MKTGAGILQLRKLGNIGAGNGYKKELGDYLGYEVERILSLLVRLEFRGIASVIKFTKKRRMRTVFE